jgi:GNAT superfamily N-acetyltransferase
MIVYIFYKYTNKIREDFENNKYTYSHSGCGHVADVGYVCPLIYKDDDITIKQFSECDKANQHKIAKHLLDEWGSDIGVKDIKSTLHFIKSHWTNTDVFYMMIKNDSNEIVGCIGIDRDNFYPYISHLYVLPEYRKNKYSLKLMRFAEKIIKDITFSESRLWCIKELQSFYEKQGYEIENKIFKKGKENLIMVKKI